MNWSSFSQISFAFAVTPRLMVQGIVYGLLLAFFGGVFPALRAARLPIVSGLRAL
jgi:putative ABC transport system permease protein